MLTGSGQIIPISQLLPFTTLGDTVYSAASGASTRLAGNVSTTLSVLTQTGDGANSAAPIWTATTGTGNIVRTTSPTLITPTLGVATATTINKVAITAPANGATLTIADGLTLNAGPGGTLGTAAFTPSTNYEVPLTFGSGVTRTVNAISLVAPTTSVFGGVKSLAAVTHNFLTSIGTDGVPVAAQPAYSDIAGTIDISSTGGPLAILRATSSTVYSSVRLYNDQNNGGRALEMAYSGSAYSGAFTTGGPSGESGNINTTGAYPLVFGTNNTARLIIDGSIGQLQSVMVAGANAIYRNTSVTGNAGFRVYNDQNSGSRAMEIAYTGSSYSGAYTTSGPSGESGNFNVTGNFPLEFGTNNTARMIILGSGNIGVGISPSEKFHVNGKPRFDSNGTAPSTTSATPASVVYGGNTAVLTTPDAWLLVSRGGTDFKVPLYL